MISVFITVALSLVFHHFYSPFWPCRLRRFPGYMALIGLFVIFWFPPNLCSSITDVILRWIYLHIVKLYVFYGPRYTAWTENPRTTWTRTTWVLMSGVRRCNGPAVSFYLTVRIKNISVRSTVFVSWFVLSVKNWGRNKIGPPLSLVSATI